MTVSSGTRLVKTEDTGAARPPARDAAEGSGLKPVLGDPGPPIVGYTFKFLRDPLTNGRQRYGHYGPVSWMKAFGATLVTLIGPDASSAVLLNKDKAFSNGKGWQYFIGPFFRRGLMLLDFDEHMHHRRIMQEAFANQRLAGYLAGMNDGIERGLGLWQPGEAFRLLPALKQLTLDTATETLCIGMRFGTVEIKAIMDQLLQRFRWTVPEDYEMPIDTTAIPVPADGLPVKLERIG